MVFVVTATLKAKGDKIEETKKLLVRAASEYVKDSETISWDVLQDAKDLTKFVIVEKYANGKSALKQHTSNPMFSQFSKALPPLLDGGKPKLEMYNELPKL